jgi:hypothetical protein
VRRTLSYLLLGAALFLGWKNFSQAAQETVVLRTSTLGSQDHFATLWVVDDHPYVWIRAEDRTRRWLPAVQAHPEVELRRNGQTLRYLATPYDTAEARASVDAMFREKYGFADRLRDLVGRRDTLPIRLEPR